MKSASLLAACAIGTVATGYLLYSNFRNTNKINTKTNNVQTKYEKAIDYLTQNKTYSANLLMESLSVIAEGLPQERITQNTAPEDMERYVANFIEGFQEKESLKAFINIISSASYPEEAKLIMLKILYNILKFTPLTQTELKNINGFQVLLDLVCDDKTPPAIRESAAITLRRATYIYYYKREKPGDVPVGTDAVQSVLDLDEKYQFKYSSKLSSMLSSTGADTLLDEGVIGILLHLCHIEQGAQRLCDKGLVAKYLKYVGHQKKAFSVTAIFGIATLVCANVLLEGHMVLEPEYISKLIAGYQGNNKCMKRLTDIFYSLLVEFLDPSFKSTNPQQQSSERTLKESTTPEYIQQKKEMILECLQQNHEGALLLFGMKSSTNGEARRKAYKMINIISTPEYWNETVTSEGGEEAAAATSTTRYKHQQIQEFAQEALRKAHEVRRAKRLKETFGEENVESIPLESILQVLQQNVPNEDL